MKTTLLTIAMFLACVINGLLLYEAFAASNVNSTEIAVQKDNLSPQKDDLSIPQITVEQGLEVQTQECEIVNSNAYWVYQPAQPVRNVVRFFHNRRPVRNFVAWCFGYNRCGRGCG